MQIHLCYELFNAVNDFNELNLEIENSNSIEIVMDMLYGYSYIALVHTFAPSSKLQLFVHSISTKLSFTTFSDFLQQSCIFSI